MYEAKFFDELCEEVERNVNTRGYISLGDFHELVLTKIRRIYGIPKRNIRKFKVDHPPEWCFSKTNLIEAYVSFNGIPDGSGIHRFTKEDKNRVIEEWEENKKTFLKRLKEAAKEATRENPEFLYLCKCLDEYLSQVES